MSTNKSIHHQRTRKLNPIIIAGIIVIGLLLVVLLTTFYNYKTSSLKTTVVQNLSCPDQTKYIKYPNLVMPGTEAIRPSIREVQAWLRAYSSSVLASALLDPNFQCKPSPEDVVPRNVCGPKPAVPPAKNPRCYTTSWTINKHEAMEYKDGWPLNGITYRCTINCENKYANTPSPTKCEPSASLEAGCHPPPATGLFPYTVTAKGSARRVIEESNEDFSARARQDVIENAGTAIFTLCANIEGNQSVKGGNPMLLCPDSYYGCSKGCYPEGYPKQPIANFTSVHNVSCKNYTLAAVEPKPYPSIDDITYIQYEASCTGECKWKQRCEPPAQTPPPNTTTISPTPPTTDTPSP